MKKKNKMIAPIVVAVLLVLYFAVYFGFLITLVNSLWKYILAVLPFAFSVIIVKVCKERINEIKEEDNDDLSKY